MGERLIILDFGSQTTQLIARRVREHGVYCEVWPFTKFREALEAEPVGVIFSGGPASVLEEGAPQVDLSLLPDSMPVLGICYGMQMLCHLGGGRVSRGTTREFGQAVIEVERAGRLIQGEAAALPVWMSHGDRVEQLPPGYEVVATSEGAPFAAVEHSALPRFGVQFHPEVVHTPWGGELLRRFAFDVCGAKGGFTADSFIERTVASIRAQVGEEGRAVCGLSGGVDSSVAATLVERAIGDRLTCVFVDNGLLRKDERAQVEAAFADRSLCLICVDARDEFLAALAGVSDPEQKRKIIGRVFIEVFEREAKRAEGAGFLVQGTLYPDVIESVSVRGPSAVIKSHHNVGGLPEHMKLELVEPLRELFKDEAREVGAALGLPKHLTARRPFPGPGLAIRVLGDITAEKLHIAREADAIFREELDKSPQADEVWQCFAALLPVRTVGVKGDARTYERVVALRAVSSTDGMTADWSGLDDALLRRVSTRIMNEVDGVGRVVYDISSKPPATIEWE